MPVLCMVHTDRTGHGTQRGTPTWVYREAYIAGIPTWAYREAYSRVHTSHTRVYTAGYTPLTPGLIQQGVLYTTRVNTAGCPIHHPGIYSRVHIPPGLWRAFQPPLGERETLCAERDLFSLRKERNLCAERLSGSLKLIKLLKGGSGP